MPCIILHWNLPSDIAIMTEEDGTPVLFASEKKAVAFAKKSCAWNWGIVKVD